MRSRRDITVSDASHLGSGNAVQSSRWPPLVVVPIQVIRDRLYGLWAGCTASTDRPTWFCRLECHYWVLSTTDVLSHPDVSTGFSLTPAVRTPYRYWHPECR
jgi:hypothetical protein